MKHKSTVPIVSANWTRFANAVLLAGSVICNSAFLYFFYNYGWTRHWQFSSSVMGPLTRYALPVFLGVAFGAALFLQPLRRINLALSVLALTIPIYCLSLLLMLDLRFPGQNVDRRTNLEVVADLRKANIRAFGPLSPIVLLNRQPDGSFKSGISDGGLEVLPLGGISGATTVLCNESGQYSIYENDEHGFNNSRGIWGTHPIEIAAVGDSFTQGSCVPPGKGFIALMRNVYPGTLSLGMSGNGPLAELATLKEYVMPLRPRIVLWCYYEENDFTDLLRERKSPLLRNYLNEGFSQDLLHRQNVIDKALPEYALAFEARPHESRNPRLTALQFVAATLKLVQVRQMLDSVFNRSDRDTDREEYGQQQMDLFKTILLQAKTLTQSWGGELYFVYLPAPDALQRDGYHRSAVLMLVRSLDLPVIDVRNGIRSSQDPWGSYQALPSRLNFLLRRRVGHFSEAGHRVAADQVLTSIFLKSKPLSDITNAETVGGTPR